MLPESGGICERLTYDLPLSYLQGGEDLSGNGSGAHAAVLVEETLPNEYDTFTGLPRLQENALHKDPTVGLCIGA